MSTEERRGNKKKGHGPGKEGIKGQYANYFKIGHNAFEFVFDFGQFYVDDGMARFHTRIISSPDRAKALSNLLRECVARYESDFGGIEEE